MVSESYLYGVDITSIRFLQRPKMLSCGNQLVHRRSRKTKLIGRYGQIRLQVKIKSQSDGWELLRRGNEDRICGKGMLSDLSERHVQRLQEVQFC